MLGPILFCAEILGSSAEILSSSAEVLRSAPAMFRSGCKVLCSDAEISNSGARTRNRRWQGNSPYPLGIVHVATLRLTVSKFLSYSG